MARTGPSTADAALLDRLQRAGRAISAAQLERWRHVGVLPANTRTYLGRGRGSTSAYSDATFEIAEAMAMVIRRGRSVYEAVLRIFTVDPRHNDLFEHPGLPIPETAIRAALAWFVRVGDRTLDRRIERAIQRLKGSPDEAAEAAVRLAREHYGALRLRPGPAAEHRPDYLNVSDRKEVEVLAALTLGGFLGIEEVGTDIVPDVIAILFRKWAKEDSKDEVRIMQDTVRSVLIGRELEGKDTVKLTEKLQSGQIIKRLDNADIRQMRDVRDKLAFVAEMGNLYVHGGGGESGRPMFERMLNASTDSFESNILFHAAIPIANTLNSDAWHRMSALLITVLAEPDEGYANMLDKLAAAAVPSRFNLA